MALKLKLIGREQFTDHQACAVWLTSVDQGTRALKDLAEKQKPRDNNAGGQGTRNGRARGASPGTARNAEAANTTANASEGTGNQQASGQRG